METRTYGTICKASRNSMEERTFEKQELEKENGEEMEDLPMDLVDEKKRQKVNSEAGNSGEIRNAMKILSWNVRGLGQSRTVRRLKNKLRHIQPQILFLMETKVTSKRMESIRRRCGFTNGIDVDTIGSMRGLSLG
ncbi:BEACH domain-containing lvsC [Gossypium australe]|uniref:BEACH domain-containing lvsC n=1 Tax=Gossypium australe TaxID=47621 RepID=A0A5B6WY41_9ROSI|nr:BEACH domain-containing lvsC [Gossypium australe]